MKLTIVTTTINEPTVAILKYISLAERFGWAFVIVGDQKTPHNSYLKLAAAHDCVAYLPPAAQERKYKVLSDLIGWNCIQRRNIGFIEAHESGAEVIATVDDDNIPYDTWGQNLAFGQKAPVALFHSPSIVFDPLSVTVNHRLWHRGFPIQFLSDRLKSKFLARIIPGEDQVMVQADLWDGEPDVDAIARIAMGPFDVQFPEEPFMATAPGPFNSQNTFIRREALPYYFMFPHIGRMDDIWASYVLQRQFPDSVVYGRASVYQARNDHDLSKDLEKEMIGYKNNKEFVEACFHVPQYADQEWMKFLPVESLEAYREYQSYLGITG